MNRHHRILPILAALLLILTPMDTRAMQPSPMASPESPVSDRPEKTVTRRFISATPHTAPGWLTVSITQYRSAYDAAHGMDDAVTRFSTDPALSPVATSPIGDNARAYAGESMINRTQTGTVVVLVVQSGTGIVTSELGSEQTVADALTVLYDVSFSTMEGGVTMLEPVPDVPYSTGGLWDLLPRIEHVPQGFTWLEDISGDAPATPQASPTARLRIMDIPAMQPIANPAHPETYVGATLGTPDAPLRIIIFMDAQCHFCHQFQTETLPLIIDDFVRPGQVLLDFREYPFLGGQDLASPTNGSSNAAQALLCAGEQDGYFPMLQALEQNFDSAGTTYTSDQLADFADQAGLDGASISSCIGDGRYVPVLAAAKITAVNEGITATPMFILDNGVSRTVVQQTSEGYDLMKRQIEVAIEMAED